MELARGKWYRDEIWEYDAGHEFCERVVNNPRVQTCMYVEEFIKYTNGLEDAVRDLCLELAELGVYLPTMDAVAVIINDTNGGA